MKLVGQTTFVTDHDTQVYLNGYIYDSNSKKSLAGASVRLLSDKDSTIIKGTFSDEKGYYSLNSTLGEFILHFTYLGYEDRYINIKLDRAKSYLKIDSVFLAEDARMLHDITVEGKMPDIVMKGDTIEYNANAFQVNDNALLKDLIENIPGAEIDEKGNLKINGKVVNKILVDGKEFFGSDLKTALENLPATMIKKLQLYNKNSETSKITGLKDKDENPVLNLVVKDEFKMTLYGNVTGGYGSDDRYMADAFLNNMGKSTNVTLLANKNNINGSGLMNEGENRTSKVGVNIVHEPSEKLNIEGSMNFDNQHSTVNSREDTQTFLDERDDRFGTNHSTVDNIGRVYNADFNFRLNFDSLSVLNVNTSTSFMKSKNNIFNYSSSYIVPDSTTIGTSHRNNNQYNFSTYNNLSFARNLGKEGRSFETGLIFTIRRGHENGLNYSSTIYPTQKNDIIDQRIKSKNNNSGFMFSAAYNEPISKNFILSFSYNIQTNNASRDNNTRRRDSADPFADSYTVIDSAYTRNTKNKYINQDIRISLQSKDYDAKWFYTLSFALNPASNRNKILLIDSLVENIKQNTLDYLPEFSLRRNFSKKKSLTFHYSGNTNQPGISQLSADTVIYSALSRGVGNPDLKMTLRNNLSLNFGSFDYEKETILNVSGSFNYTFNDIVNYITIERDGKSVSTFRNVDGQMAAYIYASYNKTLRNKKFSIMTSPNFRFSRSIGFNNNDKSRTNSYNIGGAAQLRFTSKKVRNFLSLNVSYRTSDNNLTKIQSINSTIINIFNRSIINLPLDFLISNETNLTYRWGFGSNYKKSEIIWNPSISKKILKGKQGTLKVEAFDLLNQRNNLSRIENSRGITESWTSGINRYWMISFKYNFQLSNFGTRKSDANNVLAPVYMDSSDMIIYGN